MIGTFNILTMRFLPYKVFVRPPTVGIEVNSATIRNVPIMAWDYGGLRQVCIKSDLTALVLIFCMRLTYRAVY
jgi:hypothetical protein